MPHLRPKLCGSAKCRDGPIADSCTAKKKESIRLLISASKYLRRSFKPGRFRGFEINHQCKLARLLDRQVWRLCALRDSVSTGGGPTITFEQIGAVSHLHEIRCTTNRLCHGVLIMGIKPTLPQSWHRQAQISRSDGMRTNLFLRQQNAPHADLAPVATMPGLMMRGSMCGVRRSTA